MQAWITSVQHAFESLRSNPLRTTLTVLTLVVGSLSITLVACLAASTLETIAHDIRSVGGEKIIFAFPDFEAKKARSKPAPITLDDVRALREQMPQIESIQYLESLRDQAVTVGAQTVTLDVGIGEAIPVFLCQTPMLGRMLADHDGDRAIVLTQPVATRLFSTPRNALHQRLTLWNQTYRVVGVTTSSGPCFGVGMGLNADRTAFVSAKTAIETEKLPLSGEVTLQSANTPHNHENQIAIARSILSFRHRADDVKFQDMGPFMKGFEGALRGLKLLVVLLASTGVILAGAGVMNVMLASIKQRIRDIGIHRALGANERDIRRMFGAEATLLGLVGGLVGAGIGLGLAAAIGHVLESHVPGWRDVLSFGGASFAAVASCVAGLVFGIQPARHASRLAITDCLKGSLASASASAPSAK